jgi:hypothetical protein
MKPLTPEYTEQILQQIAEFPPDAEEAAIHETADRLKAMNWQPTLLAGPPDFLTITRDQLKAFIEQLTAGRNDLTEPQPAALPLPPAPAPARRRTRGVGRSQRTDGRRLTRDFRQIISSAGWLPNARGHRAFQRGRRLRRPKRSLRGRLF